MSNQTVLVTGGAGYIGSHAVKALQQIGYEVLILDNLVYGHQDIAESLGAKLIIGDTSDRRFLDKLFSDQVKCDRPIIAVMHFAAYAYVGESVTQPDKYYRNNVVGTLTLLEAMVAANIKTFVFSSTCATYGVPQQIPITEDHPQAPINPYGATKLMVERILQDFDVAYGLKSVIFRYFNAAGADPNGAIGEDHNPETHLIPLILQTALGKREAITVYGSDYPTTDGTCIRDYIHVSDLADAHVILLEHLLAGGTNITANCGYGQGASVMDVIAALERHINAKLPVDLRERRLGDCPTLVADSSHLKSLLEWQPKYDNLDVIVADALAWERKVAAAKP